MKTTQECWQALIDGEKLRKSHWSSESFVQLVDGKLVSSRGNDTCHTFNDARDWGIYTEPKWYDSIPECGVPCYVWDHESDKPSNTLRLIKEYCAKDRFPFSYNNGLSWAYAEPVPRETLQQWLDNAG